MGPAVAAGDDAYSVTVDPTGHYAYVANAWDGTVSEYTIGSTGALTAIGTIRVGTSPVSITTAF
jgi:DNA-binding beta-propeller fold protein YncE